MSDEARARVGQTLLGKLRVLRLIGTGGMGAVYEVEHLLTGHHRALKVLRAEIADSHEAVARFVREAGMAAQLRSPHLPEVYDAGRLDDGSAYILMELLEGHTVSQLVAAEGAIAPMRAVELAVQVCDCLHAAHRAGVLHRDVKPDNVHVAAIEDREHVRVLDFGLATYLGPKTDGHGNLTRTGMIVGTVAYMSPEQISAGHLDERSDVYAVGLVLYEMLAGRPAFAATSAAEYLVAISAGRYRRLRELVPGLPRAIEAIVDRAMALDPRDRFGNAGQMREALREVYAEATGATIRVASDVAPAPAAPAPVAPVVAASPAPAPSRSWVFVAAGAAALLALIVLGAAGIYALHRLRAAPAPAATAPPRPPPIQPPAEPPPPPSVGGTELPAACEELAGYEGDDGFTLVRLVTACSWQLTDEPTKRELCARLSERFPDPAVTSPLCADVAP